MTALLRNNVGDGDCRSKLSTDQQKVAGVKAALIGLFLGNFNIVSQGFTCRYCEECFFVIEASAIEASATMIRAMR
jgi:hypothetical protein